MKHVENQNRTEIDQVIMDLLNEGASPRDGILRAIINKMSDVAVSSLDRGADINARDAHNRVFPFFYCC